MSSNTIPEVCILEYLSPDELDEDTSDGKALLEVLKEINKKQYYCCVGSVDELVSEIKKFGGSPYRYLHLSSHGDLDELGIGDDGISWEDLATQIGPILRGRRLTLSVCYGGAIDLAEPLIRICQCNSVCGPVEEIRFDEAAELWTSFYREMFPVDMESKDHRMTQKPLIRCLAKLSAQCKIPMNLYLRILAAEMVHITVDYKGAETIDDYVEHLVSLYKLGNP